MYSYPSPVGQAERKKIESQNASKTPSNPVAPTSQSEEPNVDQQLTCRVAAVVEGVTATGDGEGAGRAG